MHVKKIAFLILSVFLLFNACEDEVIQLPPSPTPSPTALKIITLGDSRVEGFRGEFESYRYELWKLLIQNQWDIDLVGTRTDDGNYPAFQNLSFDRDHEGTGGEVTSGLLNTIENLPANLVPDVALVGIGGNDLLDQMRTPEETAANIRTIVTRLQSINAEMTIFIEQIAPGVSSLMTPEFTEILSTFNGLIPEVASATTTANSKVVAVDMSDGWSDSFMADQVHYNEAGAMRVAGKYFSAIQANVEQ